MSENEMGGQAGQEKKKKKKNPSKFLVLEDLGPVENDPPPEVADFLDGLGVHGVKEGDTLMVVRLTPPGIKAARAEIKKQRVLGNLLTVCVRKRGTSSIPQQPELKGL